MSLIWFNTNGQSIVEEYKSLLLKKNTEEIEKVLRQRPRVHDTIPGNFNVFINSYNIRIPMSNFKNQYDTYFQLKRRIVSQVGDPMGNEEGIEYFSFYIGDLPTWTSDVCVEFFKEPWGDNYYFHKFQSTLPDYFIVINNKELSDTLKVGMHLQELKEKFPISYIMYEMRRNYSKTGKTEGSFFQVYHNWAFINMKVDLNTNTVKVISYEPAEQ